MPRPRPRTARATAAQNRRRSESDEPRRVTYEPNEDRTLNIERRTSNVQPRSFGYRCRLLGFGGRAGYPWRIGDNPPCLGKNPVFAVQGSAAPAPPGFRATASTELPKGSRAPETSQARSSAIAASKAASIGAG